MSAKHKYSLRGGVTCARVLNRSPLNRISGARRANKSETFVPAPSANDMESSGISRVDKNVHREKETAGD